MSIGEPANASRIGARRMSLRRAVGHAAGPDPSTIVLGRDSITFRIATTGVAARVLDIRAKVPPGHPQSRPALVGFYLRDQLETTESRDWASDRLGYVVRPGTSLETQRGDPVLRSMSFMPLMVSQEDATSAVTVIERFGSTIAATAIPTMTFGEGEREFLWNALTSLTERLASGRMAAGAPTAPALVNETSAEIPASFDVIDDPAVRAYVVTRRHLVALLHEIPTRVEQAFGRQQSLRLRLMGDPDDGTERLLVVIRTSLTAQESRPLLRRFDDEWWRDASMPAGDDLAVVVEHG